MNIAILSISILGVILLALTVYSYLSSGKYFRVFAYSFLATAVTSFILVVIKNLREQFGKDIK